MHQGPNIISAVNSAYQQIDEGAAARSKAAQMFDQAYRTGRMKQMQASLFGRSRQLLGIDENQVTQQHYEGVQTVLVAQIRGSEDRSGDFDIDFYPAQKHTQQRWVSVAAAQMRGVRLPPVELIRVGEVYYVRDGHHRISVARQFDQAMVDAVVTAWGE